ncbi:hypothetical protein [Dyadobacter sp. CY356]|uniref:hypothetical protein n=1 Tax=Dyadobacter sp. CY356 TaxID=2906442 RepID=UPI001F1A7265|nr:hypothetical protein [Dyadobacter sp. CY356]MCF0056462.1 hypothetical protein [Dyadobacter sp. CY356]
MKKIFIGIALLLVAFLLVAVFIHNLEYWSVVKWWSLNITTVGFLFLFFPTLKRYEDNGIVKLLFIPGKSYFKIIGVLIFLAILTLCYSISQQLALGLNEKIKGYYLNRKTIETTATVLGITKISFTLKTRFTQPFMIIEYVTDEGISRQGLDPKKYGYLRPAQKIQISYSKYHPSFFKVE